MVSNSLKTLVQKEAYQIVLLQLLCIVILAAFAFLMKGFNAGFSIFAGGMSYVLPNLGFVCFVFRFAGAQQMTQFLAAFLVGETIKLILSAILFLLIVKYLPVSLLSVLIGFIGAIVSFWIACMRYFSKRTMSNQNMLRS